MTRTRHQNRRVEASFGGWFDAWGGTVEKPANDTLIGDDGSLLERSNEDRFRLTLSEQGALVAAIADGAGGRGLYCGAWADELLGQLPNSPIETADAINDWIGGFWEQFALKYKAVAHQEPFLYRKFLREGSFATLSSIWLSSTLEGAHLKAALYGDSPLFICSKSEGEPRLTLLHPEPATIDRAPYLLNWQLPATVDGLRIVIGGPIRPGDFLILASDSVGQYLLLRMIYAEDAQALRNPLILKTAGIRGFSATLATESTP